METFLNWRRLPLSLALVLAACQGPAEAPWLELTELESDADSVLLVVIHPQDVFACYGTLGDLKDAGIAVVLGFASRENQMERIRLQRLRLPYKLGSAAATASYLRLEPGQMWEALVVRGRIDDSLRSPIGAPFSPLLGRRSSAVRSSRHAHQP